MTGLVIYAAGIAGVAAVATTNATSLTFAPVLVVAGLGMGGDLRTAGGHGHERRPARAGRRRFRVLNTGRQLGATLGGAITGAVLASQLAADLHTRAVAAAQALRAPAQRPFVAGFARAAHAGLQVSRGQAGARIPHGTAPALVPRLEHLIHDVFARAYIAAMHPTLAISVALLIAGALGCLLLRRTPPPAAAAMPQLSPPAAQSAVGAAPTPMPTTQGSPR
jgi:hypothetical protein